MQPLIYFTRHGLIAGDDALTRTGKAELHSIRYRLDQRGFRAVRAITSPANRCIETAQELAPGVHSTPEQELEFSTTIKLSEHRREKVVMWMLGFIPRYGDLIVVGHDSYPAALALQLITRRGGQVDWDNIPTQLRLLQRGHGLLVCGKEYTFFAPGS